jgi:hypothetical protein
MDSTSSTISSYMHHPGNPPQALAHRAMSRVTRRNMFMRMKGRRRMMGGRWRPKANVGSKRSISLN